MIKYFIEREDGSWMTPPDHYGDSWTRDPSKAWRFDASDESYVDVNGVPIRFSRACNRVLGMLQEEEGMWGLRPTEHEFIGEAKIYRSGGTSWVYMPGFDGPI